MEKIRAACVQFQHAMGDKEYNLKKVEEFCGSAAAAGVKVVCFPECCISGYWHLRKLCREDLAALAEPVPDGPACRKLSELSIKHGMIIGAGLAEVDADGKLYNTYAVALPDGSMKKHRKIHTFISPHMESGSEYTVFDTDLGWKIGVLICYDNNIIENARMTALLGADIIMAPHQTGGCNLKDPNSMGLVDRAKWDNREADPEAVEEELKGNKGRGWLMRWLPSRAHDNGVFYLFSNGVGPDDDEIRTGNAMIIDCYGRVIAETWKAGDDMVVADLDPALFKKVTGRRWIRTRRPELYGKICEGAGSTEDVKKVRFEHEKEA
ncbi:MAG: nitrilase family protein [Planctomycetes bacterium]|nr:nitrilase family protein [Planctomycetota bacterium]